MDDQETLAYLCGFNGPGREGWRDLKVIKILWPKTSLAHDNLARATVADVGLENMRAAGRRDQ